MGSKQATLSRATAGAPDPEYTARIVLSAGRVTGSPHAGVRTDIASLFAYTQHSNRSWEEKWDSAWASADKILDAGSPAVFPSPHPELDKIVYIYGDSKNNVLRDTHRVAQADSVDARQIVVPSFASLGTTLGEIAGSLESLAGIGAKLTVLRGGERLDYLPGSSELRAVISGFRAAGEEGIQFQREAEKRDLRLWADWDKDGGRAGLGFEWVDNELVPADNYDEVCAVLEMVVSGEMTKSKAAAHLDTSPRTITRCIEERPERYGLHLV